MGYLYEKDELENVFETKTFIVFDTNVWLDMYTYSPSIINTIISCLSKKSELLWLPYQVYIEFNRHVVSCRSKTLNRYVDLKGNVSELLSNSLNKINSEFNKLKSKEITDIESLQGELTTQIKSTLKFAKEEIDILNQAYIDETVLLSEDKDIVSNLIEKLHHESETKGFERLELVTIYEEGALRYKYKISPGYTDESKKDKYEDESSYLLRKYGDLIIWKEILKKISNTNTNIVLVQGERKSDWWYKKQNDHKDIPKELIEEFDKAALPNSNLYMIDFEEFLYHFGDRFRMPAGTIKEITTKLNFEKKICEYIEANIVSLIEYVLNEDVSNCNDVFYDVIQDVSFFGGYVESVENFEIGKINISNEEFVQCNEFDENHIYADVRISAEADIREYVNKYVVHSGRIKIDFNFPLMISVVINTSDVANDPKESFDFESILITFEEISISDVNSDDFSIDVDVDEDMFRER